MDFLEHKKMLNEGFAKVFNETDGELHLKDGINCEHCRNKGLVQVLDDEYSLYVVNCPKCKLKRKVYKTIKESGLENLFKKYTLENYQTDFKGSNSWQKVVKSRAIEFINESNNGYWFTILGQSGSGKTHISTAISKELVEKGYDFEWLTFTSRLPYLYKEINSGFIDVKEKANKEMDRIKKVKVLYIDDLFKGKFDNDLLTIMFDILNYRYYNEELITIISSEMTEDKLNMLDQAIAGRIKERSKQGYYVINLDGIEKNLRIK